MTKSATGFTPSEISRRVVVSVLFLTKSGAAAGIEALRAAEYDVLVGDGIVDEDSDETMFIEVYKLAASELEDEVWDDVRRIVEPHDGDANSCGVIDDDTTYVPFREFADPPQLIPPWRASCSAS